MMAIAVGSKVCILSAAEAEFVREVLSGNSDPMAVALLAKLDVTVPVF